MKKIGVFSRPIEVGTSGSGSHLEKLMTEVVKQNCKYEFYFIHHKESGKDFFRNKNEIIISRNPLIAFFQLRKYRLDLLHYSPMTILYPFIFMKSVKKVATIHGGAIFFLPEQYSVIMKLHERFIRPYMARKMDYIFTVSKHSKELIINHDKVKESLISVINNGVDEEFISSPDNSFNDIQEKFKIEMPYVYHISKYSDRKNPWVILKSFLEVTKENNNILLVISGSGWQNEEVISFLKQHGIETRVIFTGYVSNEDLSLLYRNAKVFIFPSLYEGFGMPNLEAMACGCPVITSNAYAIPEIVDDAAIILKNNKDYLELSKWIITLVSNEGIRKSLIEKGYERAKMFSWHESANEVLKKYDMLLEE